MSARAAGVYLGSYLDPLASVLQRLDVTDIYVNRPGEIWVETLGGKVERHDAPELGAGTLDRLARQVAAYAHQGISRANPLLSATLPDGARIQIIAPPATRAHLALAIRKHVVADMTLADYSAAGAFLHAGGQSSEDTRAHIAELIGQRAYAEALATAVRARMNIVVSGGTSTGKTTLLNALIREIPRDERLIFIEDAGELRFEHENVVPLISVRGSQGEAQVDANDLLAASLRMRPDRIILGELRGEEAFTFLRAINTGHPGSMTSVHADSPEKAVDQIVLMILQGGSALGRADVRHYVQSSVGLYVHLANHGGRRVVEQIKLVHE